MPSLKSTDALLKSVSRTFYLTLKVLPRRFREPVSLAYLLARATDTIADTAAADSSLRFDLLGQFSDLVAHSGDQIIDPSFFTDRLTEDFSPSQPDPAEAELLDRVGDLLAWLNRLDPFDQKSIRDVLSEIITGQIEDLENFPSDGSLRALPDADALDRYTYQVAGSVGEFWTRLGFHAFATRYSRSPEHDLLPSGIRLGKGLQLINILRDIPEDLSAGRCYLPADELADAGLSFPQPIPKDAGDLASLFSKIRPVAESWLTTCSDHLDHGLTYAMRIRHRRLRFATALPLNFAARTATLLKSATDEDWLSRIKMNKSETKIIGKKTLRCLISPRMLQPLYGELST